MRCPSPDHWETDPLGGLSQDQYQGDRSLIFFSCLKITSVHVQHIYPHHTIRSFISSISGTPFNTMFVLPFLHLRRPQSFPPTNHRRHERNWPLTRDIFWNQEEHRCAGLLQPSPTLFHLLQIHHFSPLCLLSYPAELWGGSRGILLPSLPCKSSPLSLDHFLSTFGMSSSSFFNT